MIDICYKIKNSQPTITGVEAAAKISEIILDKDSVVYASEKMGMENTTILANAFVDALAKVEIVGIPDQLNTFQPVHVLHSTGSNPEKISNIWAITYSNGAIIFSEDTQGNDYLYVVLSKQTYDNLQALTKLHAKQQSENIDE